MKHNAFARDTPPPSGVSSMLKSSTSEPGVATVNFSVPQDVKDAFNRAFHGRNKSAILAELMRKAVAEAALQEHRLRLFEELTEGRKDRPTLTASQARRTRQAGRP